MAGEFNLLIAPAPDPLPASGLVNPWETISVGDNAIPLSATSPLTPPATESTGGASGSWSPPWAAAGIVEGESGGIPDLIESWWTGYSASGLQSAGAQLDAQLAKMNEEAHAKGTIDDVTYKTTVEHLATQIAATHDIPADINAGYVEGALAGYKSDLAVLEGIPKYAGRITGDVLGAVLSGTGTGLGSILGAIPLWVWIGGAIALFFYLGGGKAVEFQARRRIARYAH
jgi:hypothetical protein